MTSQDKSPSVISRVLKKNNRDSAVASEFELVQLLPGERGQRPRRKADLGGEWCPSVEYFHIWAVVGGMTVCS